MDLDMAVPQAALNALKETALEYAFMMNELGMVK